jgi:hypothetical protein
MLGSKAAPGRFQTNGCFSGRPLLTFAAGRMLPRIALEHPPPLFLDAMNNFSTALIDYRDQQ